jgi:hypothetical protein
MDLPVALAPALRRAVGLAFAVLLLGDVSTAVLMFGGAAGAMR